jgi:hypothetical protein
MERGDLTRLIDRIEAPLFLACGATGAGLQERVWWGVAVGIAALAAVLLLVLHDRRALERGAEPSMGMGDYRRLVRLLWWASGMVLAGSIVTAVVRALVSVVTGTGQ